MTIQLSRPERTPQRIDGYPPIGSYAAIGDGHTLGLVAEDGAIEWLCLPTFDAAPVFDAAVDAASGGRFTLQPTIPFETQRRYVERTNVLETDFHTTEGTVRVTDAMTFDIGAQAPWRELVRRVQGLSGRVPMAWRMQPRFDFGRQQTELEHVEGAWLAQGGTVMMGLRSWDVGEAQLDHGALAASFTATEGSDALLALTAVDRVPLALPARDALLRRLETTIEGWRHWIGRLRYDGQWRPAVERSLLALRLLTDDRAGAIVAAGTTSLPEVVGGGRNYDYRFGWVRDASFAMDAFMRLGYEEVAHASFNWLLGAEGRTHPRLNPVYRLDGDTVRSQQSLSLPGYRHSAPVHVGNQAGSQRQLGGWGDFVETAYLYVDQGHRLDRETSQRLADLADLVVHIWRRHDAGLWEISDADYTTSKLSCWTVFHRVVQLAERGHVPARHMETWRTTRDTIREYIDTRMWSADKRSYVQKSGSDALDVGVLLAARRGYVERGSERLDGTIDAIRRELSAGGPLLYRYSGMQDQENAFLACSFWLVEALAHNGRLQEASETMDAMVGLATDVGLYSEEMEPGTHAMRGNIPQALTHLSLLNAAALLHERRQEDGAG